MFKLKFHTINDAFYYSPANEAARILREIADQLESGEQIEGRARDINGNAVGEWKLKP